MQELKLKKIFIGICFCLFGFSSIAQSPAKIDSTSTSTEKSIISLDDTVTIINSKQVDEIISFAKTFLGTPYHYAGSSPSGFDCSGFIYYVMGNFGMTLTHSSYGMAEFGETVKLSEIRPGDLMFFKGSNVNASRVGHVSLVVEVTPDAIMFIHSSTSRGVIIENFKTSRYFIPRFIKAKRLDFGEKSN